MLTIKHIIELKEIIKWHTVFCEAGLNSNTMRSAMHNERELRPEEVNAILNTLSQKGIVLIKQGQRELFAMDSDA